MKWSNEHKILECSIPYVTIWKTFSRTFCFHFKNPINRLTNTASLHQVRLSSDFSLWWMCPPLVEFREWFERKVSRRYSLNCSSFSLRSSIPYERFSVTDADSAPDLRLTNGDHDDSSSSDSSRCSTPEPLPSPTKPLINLETHDVRSSFFASLSVVLFSLV